jgi:hypothetical protein
MSTMALHRDIFWVGRQWAVTGFGVQAVDQRLKGAFDIEACRLWEEGLIERTRALGWLNRDDFGKALEIARSRSPEPPRKTLPLVESVLELIQPKPAEAKTSTLARTKVGQAEPAPRPEPMPDLPRALAMQVLRASAKFVPLWRVRF